jgi:Predicted membrane protein (DUF2306)
VLRDNVSAAPAQATSSLRRSWWLSGPGLLLLSGVITGAVAWWLIAEPVATFTVTAKHAGHFGFVFAHMLGGTVMLFLGAANLYVGSTRTFFRYHRLLGYTYLGGGSAAALIASWLALAPFHGRTRLTDSGLALATLAIAWIVTAAMAYRAARNRRLDTHRAWVVRSYVLTWSFVLCRLVSRVPAMDHLGNGAAIVWLTWIVPLLVCEVVLQWPAGAPKRTAMAARS